MGIVFEKPPDVAECSDGLQCAAALLIDAE